MMFHWVWLPYNYVQNKRHDETLLVKMLERIGINLIWETILESYNDRTAVVRGMISIRLVERVNWLRDN